MLIPLKDVWSQFNKICEDMVTRELKFLLSVGQNPPRTKPPLLIFVYVDKIPPMNFTTRT